MTTPRIPWAAIPLFQCLRPGERDSLEAFARLKSYEEGAVIFREGETASWVHTILGGRIKIVKSAHDGHAVILEILEPGDPVGAVAAYQERAFPASAIALEATTLVSIPRKEFFQILAGNPQLALGLLAGVTLRLMELTRRLSDRSARVEYRIARLFLTLDDRLGRSSESGSFIPVVLSRQEIADLVGTTPETAIRVLSRWGKDVIVTTGPDGFTVRDRKKLEEIPPDS